MSWKVKANIMNTTDTADTVRATDTSVATPVSKPKADRFLIGIIIGFAVLLVVAGVSVWLLRQPVPELPANTPGGMVQRFYGAVENQDYDKAYSYLADSMKDKPTRDEFVRYNIQSHQYDQQNRVRIDKENINGDNATVNVGITYYYQSSGPFSGSGEYTSTQIFSLQREKGDWRITILPYEYMPPTNTP
jgi:hypothetical protein